MFERIPSAFVVYKIYVYTGTMVNTYIILKTDRVFIYNKQIK